MATYNQVSYGSKGSSVTELQKLLNNNGYNLSADGIFGAQTQAAVKDYQQKNGLSVDGIVGNNTWGALTKASTPAATTPTPATTQNTTQAATPATTPATTAWSYEDFSVSDSTAAADQKRQELAAQKPGEFTYDSYEKSEAVKQAEALLQQQLGNNPGAYQSQWQTQLDETLNKILNREKFSYDLNGDALYQQYKDQYILQGQQAMMDTMGQAAAMTGGYGNSYAQTAGQQTYQGYLQQLNDRVPELYQLAQNQYNQEGQDLYNQYGLYADREDQDYGRYRDTVSDYYTELNRLTEDARYQAETEYGKYMDAFNMAYGQHRDQVSDYYTDLGLANEDYWNQYNRDYGQYSDNRNLSYQQNRDQVSDTQWGQTFQYQQERDAIADQQWQTQFDEAQRQYDEQMALTMEQWAWEQAQAAAGGVGGAGGNGGGDGGDAPGVEFNKAVFSRVDENGNYVFYIDGKERTYAPGVNPYTGSKNSDTKYGTFSNGYQPNNVKGQKLAKSGITDVVNGVTQNVWKTPDGKLWIWDGTQNRYLEYDDGQNAPQKSSNSGGGGRNKQTNMLN